MSKKKQSKADTKAKKKQDSTGTKAGKKANQKGALSGLRGLSSGQQVAGAAALLAAVGVGYWAQRRRVTPATPPATANAD